MLRKLRWMIPLALVAVVAVGCEDDVIDIADPEDLAPPLGLTSITGDGAVSLSWQASNYDEDRDGFYVFQANSVQAGTPETIPAAFGTEPVATLTTGQEAGSFGTTVTGLSNGTTYSFLVVAFKDDGDEVSRPSNIVVDTPREESTSSIALLNGVGNARYLDVDTQSSQTLEDVPAAADILCQSFNAGAGDRHGMVGVNGARIQDLGYVGNWDEIDEAPLGLGSYPAADYSVQVLPGHVYAVFTGAGYYAKVYVVSVNGGNFGYTVRVAYQPQQGNNELAPGRPGAN